MCTDHVQPAIKKETFRIAIGTALGTLVMFFVFAFLCSIISIPFDYKIILSGILGAAAACLNFFLMGLTVQKAASAETKEAALQTIKASYRFRTAGQLVWSVFALTLPFLNGAAGIIPLFIPGICIKAGSLSGIRKKEKGEE